MLDSFHGSWVNSRWPFVVGWLIGITCPIKAANFHRGNSFQILVSHSLKKFGIRRYEGCVDLVQANPKLRDNLERFWGCFFLPLSWRN